MTRSPLTFLAPVVLVAVVVGLFVLNRSDDDGYELDVVMPSAANLVPGGRVLVNGFEAGSVEGISLRENKAVVTVSVSDDYAPIPAGTTARIEYQALLGERNVVLQTPADASSFLDDGDMITGAARVDIDQLLDVLDEPTRAQLRELVPQMAGLLDGREGDINESLVAAGPTVDALGQVLTALGQDGAMLQQLIDDTRAISETVSERRSEVAGTIDGITRALEAAAAERDDLSVALDALPETVAEATDVLERLPNTVDVVDPLLAALQPAIEQLPGVAQDLRPLLADLRPAVTDLEPALANLGIVLDQAPALLDLTTAVLPTLDTGLTDALPAVDFLRPYTPELVGWMQNWADAASAMDENGRYIRLVAKMGIGNALLPPQIPGQITDIMSQNVEGLSGTPYRAPGELVDQPWTDANGDPVN